MNDDADEINQGNDEQNVQKVSKSNEKLGLKDEHEQHRAKRGVKASNHDIGVFFGGVAAAIGLCFFVFIFMKVLRGGCNCEWGMLIHLIYNLNFYFCYYRLRCSTSTATSSSPRPTYGATSSLFRPLVS